MNTKSPAVSFEFFPPKTPEMERKLWQSVTELAPLAPQFVSVTYGAGGSTRERTHQTVKRILQETTLKPAAHLTCIGACKTEIDAIARAYWDAGVRHIVALRGDSPDGTKYVPSPKGYAYADSLVAGLKQVGDFEISVAAYPETHPDAQSPQADLDHLKRKIDAGATRAITQCFFDVSHYDRFLERVRRAGITVPVIPGILPVGNIAQLIKFSALCGASIPEWLPKRLEGLTPEAHNQAAIAIATELCEALQKLGVDEFHFYTLNRADLTTAICKALK